MRIYQRICRCDARRSGITKASVDNQCTGGFVNMSRGKSSIQEDRIKALVGIKCIGAPRIVTRGK